MAGRNPHDNALERQQWNNLLDALRFTALQYPERGVHVIDERGRQEFRTWAQLLERSRRVAAALRASGVGRSERVIFVFPTSFEFISAFLGALAIGAVPVPLAPPRPSVTSAEQIAEYFLRTAERLDATSILFHSNIDRAYRPPQFGRIHTIVDYNSLLDSVEMGAAAALPEDLPSVAYMQLTSGATGNAVGVAVSHQNILSNLEAVGNALKVVDDDVGISWLPNYTIMGLVGVICFTLYWSLDVVLLDPERFLRRPDEWLWAFTQHRGSLSVAPSFSYRYCVRRAQRSQLRDLDLSSWRVAMNGGEPVRVEDMQAFGRRFGHHGLAPDVFMPVYGLTEATLAVTFAALEERPILDTVDRARLEVDGFAEPAPRDESPDHARAQFVSVGTALDGISIEIVDDGGKPLPARHLGEIVVTGPNVTLGYVGERGKRSAQNTRFEGDRLFTGDLGYMVDGQLFVVGRASDVIRHVGGRRLFPEEMQHVINEVDGVRTGTAAVFGVDGPDSESRDRLIVAFEAQDGADFQQMSDLVRSRIMRGFTVDPDEVLVLSPKSIPRSASGKVRREVARKLYRKGDLDRRERGRDLDGVRRTIVRARHSLLKAGQAFLANLRGED
jgi:acyl-CoA synthetase (AMP-forming)/AMP-acid ligase II